MPYTSQTDFVIFRRNCLNVDLPDPAEKNLINGMSLPRYVYLDEGRRFFKSKGAKDETTKIFNKYLELHRTLSDLDVQLIPVSVLWGRSPGHENGTRLPNLRLLNGMQKIFAAIWFGRDTFVRFSQALSLRYMIQAHGSDEKIAQKLARVAKMHFAKQRMSATGPRLPNRQAMFNKLLNSETIKAAIDDEAKTSGINPFRLRKTIIIASTILISSSVTVSGIIGWVGLVIPHFTRKIIGANHGYVIPLSGLSGAFFMLICDDLARSVSAAEVPIGIITALLGAPLFALLWIFKKQGMNEE